jgi:hypothetical protein
MLLPLVHADAMETNDIMVAICRLDLGEFPFWVRVSAIAEVIQLCRVNTRELSRIVARRSINP